MQSFNGQLIIIADPIQTKLITNQDKGTACLENEIKGKNVLYTSLLPGPETEAAEIALKLKIPYIAAIPYRSYYLRWSQKARNKYLRLLKKSIRTIYVDREPGFISEICPPDRRSLDKDLTQVQWLVSKVGLFSGVTHIITYTSGFYSPKSQTLNSALSHTAGNWHLTEKTHMEILDPAHDDLPF